ncbi:hypothetical protein GCM10009759_67060 [Kitasatospora saccharophila]|uniref:Condensation domain-containing protein n=1 Tax=Kitasatospora saccharophila TaxID=407973 RepID=A0ABP5JNM1_9ACTN
MQNSSAVSGPATFGQLSLWRSIANIPPTACNLPQTWALPPGTDPDAVGRALERLEARHESLRTRYAETAEGGLVQLVEPAAPADLDLVEGVPAEVSAELAAVPFDPTADRPWRAALVTERGVPTALAICFHHIAVDAWAINQLHEEFGVLVAGGELPGAAPSCRELAAEQWSEARANRRRAALRHWRQVLADAPPMARDAAPEAVTSRWARHGSAPAGEAVRTLAERLGVSAPSVLLAAFCAALARHTGEERVLVAVYANNRSDPRWEGLVAAQNQIIPLLVQTTPDEEFGAFATRVHWELIRSYKHAAYNVDDALLAGAENGYEGTVNGSFAGSVSGFFRYFFNYLGDYQRDQTPVNSAMETGTGGRNIGAPLYLQVQDGDALTSTLRENSSSADFKVVTEILLALEDVLVSAAANPAEPAEPVDSAE